MDPTSVDAKTARGQNAHLKSGRSKFEQRVIDAANAVLRRDGAVGPIELLVQMRVVDRICIDRWRFRSPGYEVLESHIQCGQKKLDDTLRIFKCWANQESLEPTPAVYRGFGREGDAELQIHSAHKHPTDSVFRTRYRRRDLTDARKKQIDKKLNKPPELTVFVVDDKPEQCSECGTAIAKDGWVFREASDALCLTCADFDHLTFLPSGDATLSRRTKKLSSLTVVVTQFNRRRKRFERRGLLVTAGAIRQAEDSMSLDADKRAKQRAVAEVRRAEDDEKLTDQIRECIRENFPQCPADDALRIASHTAERGSGRVGRSEAGRAAQTDAVKLAVIAHIRHEHTDYDKMLMDGVPRRDARKQIQTTVQRKLKQWQGG